MFSPPCCEARRVFTKLDFTDNTMIILPSRQKLLHRRDRLYAHLASIIHVASVHQVEDVMRRIHSINIRLRTYWKDGREPKEIFLDDDEKDPVKA